MADLTTPLRAVVGAKTAAALATGLELHTVGDLLRHYPRRYATRGEHTDISALALGEESTIMAQVLRVQTRPLRNRRGSLLEVVVGEAGATLTASSSIRNRRWITLTFFNQAWRARDLTPGRWGLFAGKVGQYRGTLQLQHPEYRLFDATHKLTDQQSPPTESSEEIEQFAGALIPVYPASSQTPTWVVSRCVRVALDTLGPVGDPLPHELRDQYDLVELPIALRDIHRPSSLAARDAAHRRLAFDEALSLQLVLAQRRATSMERAAIARPQRSEGLLAAFDAICPFTLTRGQQEIGEVVSRELASSMPMNRLLQGEVGSGKTLVALRAMLQIVDAGAQAVLVAPTEVLAAQHANTIAELLGPLGLAGELGASPQATRLVLLTGSLSAASRRAALAAIAGETERAGIVIGTHALFQQTVRFAEVGLVVIDEQHRFGVEQRDVLRAKAGGDGQLNSVSPHILVMTATPIPRTVAMTVYGDLEISSLTELPAGRSPISTTVVPVAERPTWIQRAWDRIREEVSSGHQVYVVCPRIGDGESEEELLTDEADLIEQTNERRPPLAVTQVAEELAAGPLAGLRLGVLHGRLTSEGKDSVMADFAAGKLDVMVATTIIEVGVNVPNATMMVILDAERFGVSQLHQLRGRVGRGTAAGLCLLVTEAPENSSSRQRLDAVASTTDGFRLAELDLEQRREGDVLGAAQSGRRSTLKILSLLRDRALIEQARKVATEIITSDPNLIKYRLLATQAALLVDPQRAEYLEKH